MMPSLMTSALAATLATAGAPLPDTMQTTSAIGRWTVEETVWSAPGAAPVFTHDLVADRRMVGAFLEETLHTRASDTPLRIDYLGYDQTAGQWDYMSLDNRALVPLMPAWSFEPDKPDRIVVRFQPFAMPGGQMLRMEEVIARTDADHETKDQYFILANGSGTRWLAHRYTYTRASTPQPR